MITYQTTGDTGAGLWLRWVLANALGGALGLGGTALIWTLSVLYAGEGTGPYAILILAAFSVLAGTLIEGTVFGTAQWLVLRRPLPRMRWRTWVLATGAGAFLAWMLGKHCTRGASVWEWASNVPAKSPTSYSRAPEIFQPSRPSPPPTG